MALGCKKHPLAQWFRVRGLTERKAATLRQAQARCGAAARCASQTGTASAGIGLPMR